MKFANGVCFTRHFFLFLRVMRKIIVAFDSMKGCLSSRDASAAFAQGVRNVDSEAQVLVVPVADGGEGTARVLAEAAGLTAPLYSSVCGPMGDEVYAEWWFDDNSRTAYIDMAQASGLTLVDKSGRNPLCATSHGFGELIAKALDRGASSIVVGLGGSATVDGGSGACQALGVRFFDKGKTLIRSYMDGSRLSSVTDIDVSRLDSRLRDVCLTLVCDVVNRLTGVGGAAEVFAPQKGASADDVTLLDNGLENFRNLIFRKFGVDLNCIPGSGAAGGCAGGLMALAGGVIREGAPLVLDALHFGSLLEGASAVVTGEGASDSQTLMGKLPCAILRFGLKAHVPVALVAGVIKDRERLEKAGFSPVIHINSPEIIAASHTSGGIDTDAAIAARRLQAAGKEFARYVKFH